MLNELLVNTSLGILLSSGRYLTQQDKEYICAPIAVVNACAFLGIRKPSIMKISKEMRCNEFWGGTESGMLEIVAKKRLSKWMVEVQTIEEFLNHGGIFIIKGDNGFSHTCVCILQKNGRYTLINKKISTEHTKYGIKRMLSMYDQWFFAFKKKFIFGIYNGKKKGIIGWYKKINKNVDLA